MNFRKTKNLKLLLISLPLCALACSGLIFFNQNSVFTSNENQDKNLFESTTQAENGSHVILAKTNLDNNVELSTTEAVAGDIVTATVTDPKYGYNIAEASFIDDEEEVVENVNYEVAGDVVKFTMPNKPVKLCVSYSTVATSAYNTPQKYEGKMTWNKEKDPTSVYSTFGMDLLTEGNNQAYSKELSVMSSLFSNAAYYKAGSEADLDGSKVVWNNMPTTSRPDYDVYTNLGFKDVQYVKLASKNPLESDDVTDAYFAYVPVLKDNGDVVNVYVCSVRGTNGTLKEWSSNFDVGADTEDYWARKAKNTDGGGHWTNTANHKGFDVTANLVYAELENYIANHNVGDVSQASNNYILMTGHSRGASIANLLGAKLIDTIGSGKKFTNFVPFTYTFAAPRSTTATAANTSKYASIWNIINGDDTVPTLPYTFWGFNLYGQSKSYTVSTDDALEDAVEDNAGWIDYWDPFDSIFTDLEGYAKQMTTTREGLYKIPDKDEQFHGRKCNYQLNLKSLEKNTKVLEDTGYAKFCKISTIPWFLSYATFIQPSPAFCMYYLAHLASDASYLYKVPYHVEIDGVYDSYRDLFGLDGALFMSDPHQVVTYYTMVRNRNF